MKNLPYPWDHYLREQTALAVSCTTGTRSRRLEDRLNRRLDNIGHEPPTEAQLDRAAAHANRRDRHRASLHLVYLTPANQGHCLDGVYEARQQLQAMCSRVNADDWRLLLAVGEGREYSEIVGGRAASEGALRVRVLRLRQLLREQPHDRSLAA